MAYTSKLPDQPSALIRAALADLQKCIDDPIYKIDMKTWHKPVDNGKHCSVCLAGSVLAQTFKVPPSESIPAIRHFVDCNELDKLEALDYFRTGNIFDGLILLGRDTQGVIALDEINQLNGSISEFDEHSPEEFFHNIKSIANAFERCGY